MRKILKEKARNMFLWVWLLIERLKSLESSSPGHILRELRSMPEDLIDTYVKIFAHQLATYEAAIKRTLPWLLHADRLLTVDELIDVLALQDYLEFEEGDLDHWRSTDMEGDLNRTFGTLVTIDRSIASTALVRFFHDSVKDALLGHTTPCRDELVRICRAPEDEHAEIGAACLAYLALPAFQCRIESYHDLSKLLEEYPFLRYAATKWSHHAQNANKTDTKITESFKHLAQMEVNLNLAFNIYRQSRFVKRSKAPVIQTLLSMGLEHLAICLLDKGPNIYKMTSGEKYIVHEAAKYGAMIFLKRILQDGSFRIDVRDSVEHTALHRAAVNGHVDMVRFLIEQQLPLNDRSIHDETPLHYATKKGHWEVVRLLLEKGADVNVADWRGAAPLHVSARFGHSEVTQLLIDHGADITVETKEGETALGWARKYGREAAIKILEAAEECARNTG
ncbi:ankyrin repeat-containing domain protein [Nemania sp. FL0916]|nr:ankyrin repeat-containing domain protein [Nemania sp. FL0916]